MGTCIVEMALESGDCGIFDGGYTIIETRVSDFAAADRPRLAAHRAANLNELLNSSGHRLMDASTIYPRVLQELLSGFSINILHDDVTKPGRIVEGKVDFGNADVAIGAVIHSLAYLVLRARLAHSGIVTELDPGNRIIY